MWESKKKGREGGRGLYKEEGLCRSAREEEGDVGGRKREKNPIGGGGAADNGCKGKYVKSEQRRESGAYSFFMTVACM